MNFRVFCTRSSAFCIMGIVALLAVRADEPIAFERFQLSDEFYSEGGTFGDFDSDGKNDIAVGPWIYWGPDFTTSSRIYEGEAFDPLVYSRNFVMDVSDISGDGYADIVVVGFPGDESWWFENPGKDKTRELWQRHVIMSVVDNESPWATDIDSDGTIDLVCSSGGHYGYASYAGQDPRTPWKFYKISPNNNYQRFTHGLGVGDVDNDGHKDLLEKDGWWKNPGKPTEEHWTYHPFQFAGPGGSQMHAVDLDGDGKNEVVTSLAAHGFGLVYFKATNDGATDFQRFEIMTDDDATSPTGIAISQLHAVEIADMNRDGVPDIITGKRWWAHAAGDNGSTQPARLAWFETQRVGGRVQFIPHVVDNSSGVGTDISVGDVNGDGLIDIVSGTKRGAHLFLQKPGNFKNNLSLIPELASKDAFGQLLATEVIALSDDSFVPAIQGRPLNFDFVGDELVDWEARGPSGRGTREALASKEPTSDTFRGINTGSQHPEWIGELISRPFTLSKPKLSALVSGSDTGDTVFVEVISDRTGKRLATISGEGRTEPASVTVDLSEFVGEPVRLRVVDHSNKGFIRAGQFRLE